MFNTFSNFKKLAYFYEGGKGLNEAILNYQQYQDPIIYSYIFCSLFPLILTICNKYFNLTDQDKASFVTEELHKALLEYDRDKGASFQTFFVKYLTNKLRGQTEMLNHQIRKGNYNTNLFENSNLYYQDQELEKIELIETIKQLPLNDKEEKYCKLIIDTENKINKTDIAVYLKVTSPAITYIRKQLSKKLQCAF